MPKSRAVPSVLEAALELLEVKDLQPHRLFRASDLRALGMTKREVGAARAAGQLTVVRRGVYLLTGAPDHVRRAARAGGRVACVTLLRALGVFVLREGCPHVHFERSTSKGEPAKRTQVWHWKPLARAPHPRATAVEVIDALIQSTSCQGVREAIATLDSALFLGFIDLDDLDEIFAHVPPRRRVLRRFVDGRAESGPESIVRMMALVLGFEVKVQVTFRAIGRVDLVLDGWLVVECDSEEHHSGWASQKKDRRRDLALAARGMASLRPIAEDVMYNPDRVIAALRGLRDARREGWSAVPVPSSC